MRLLIELSGEHPTLPVAEVRACMEACDIEYNELYHNGIYIAEIGKNNGLEKFASRLSMAHSINEIMEEMKVDGSFKIEGGSLETRKKFGEIFVRKGGKVDLKNPDVIIRIFNGIACRQLIKIDRGQYEKRRPSRRPFSPPISLHPGVARAIVNLTRVKENEVLLDPFCGSGGILIEGGLVGARVVGIDVKRKMVEGCKKNLKYMGIDGEIICEDMRRVEMRVDAIATDFPYGRSTHLSDKMEKLYEEGLIKLGEFLRKGRRAVVGLPFLHYEKIGEHFDIEEIHCLRAHKSLTRFFYVLRKK